MKNQIRRLFFGTMFMALALGSGCNKAAPSSTASSGDSDDSSKGSLETRVDHHGDEIMASTTKAEARVWMKQPKHVFFKADPKQVGQFVEEFYGAGATQVLIADIEEEQGAQYGEGMLVVLPKEKEARAKLFEIGARADAIYEEDPVTDKGQKYLYYSLD
jgi:hypothetical protein